MINKKIKLLVGIFIISGLIANFLYSPDISVAELKQNYANQNSKFVSVDGMDVHYRDEGTGEVIVLLHGTGASLHTWDKWTDVLKTRFRVIRLDLPAYGLTGPHPQHKYLIPDYSKFLNTFLNTLQIEEFILAGNSLGGSIAWYYTSEYPKKVKLLSLLNPGGFLNQNKKSPLVFRLSRAPLVKDVLRYVTPRFFVKNTLKEVYFDKNKLTDIKIDTYRDLMLRENNREAFIVRSSLKSSDYTKRLELISTPTQILWGNEDSWIPVENARLFEKALLNSKVDIMKETGHIPMEERPYESLELLLKFIEINK